MPPSLATLPTELLLAISEGITTEADLNTLTQLNRRLYNLLNSFLYRNHVQKYGSKTVLWAAEHGQKRTLHFLLSHGADITVKNDDNETPFILAAKFGHLELLGDVLCIDGVDHMEQDKRRHTALTHASRSGHADVVEFLLTLDGMNPNHISIGEPEYSYGRSREDTPFRVAAEEGHTDIVRILLATNKIQYKKDLLPTSSSAFTRSLKRGHIDIIRILLDLGANPNEIYAPTSGSPLRLAAENGHADMVELLLATGKVQVNMDLDLQPQSAFYRAITRDHRAVVEILITLGADPFAAADEGYQGYTPLHYAARNGSLDVARYLLSLPGIDPDQIALDRSTPFAQATVMENNLPIMKVLFETGKVNPNFRADFTLSSPLCIAAERGSLQIVEWLLSLPPPPSALSVDTEERKPRLVDVNIKDHYGQTPLYRACVSGRTEIVSLLLSQPDILPSEPDFRGQRPFMAAVRKGRVDIVDLLLSRDDTASDFDHEWQGETPLLIAASLNKESVVKRLIEKGVRINVQDQHLRTPFDHARWWENVEMEQVLEEYARKCRFRRRRGVKERVAMIEGGIEGRMAALAMEVRDRVGVGS
ncbi:ankyrin repeat-containing domain protein [Aspergillus crustosus]